MRDTRLEELDLRAGVITNATGYELGPTRLRQAQNAVWAPVWSTDSILRRGLMLSTAPSASFVVSFVGGQYVLGMGFIRGADLGRAGIAATRTAANEILLHRLSDGTSILSTGMPASEYGRSAPAVYWTGVEAPAVYVSHPSSGETWRGDEGGMAIYTPANETPGTLFKGNTALIVHLDRLWMAKINELTSPMDSTIYYSDPFDPETVRATSFLTISDNVRCMFRPGASDAGTPHMVIGGDRAIHVLDGDPIFGNAVLRRLSFNIGIADLSLVAETHFGAVILATDRRFYLIPTGATQLVPIPGLEDQVTAAFPNITGTTKTDSLAWSPPYVYYHTDAGTWLLDFTDQQRPKWWGPITLHTSMTRPLRVQGIGPGADAVQADLWFTTFDTTVGNVFRLSPNAVNPTARAVVLRTGYIHVPGHRVELRNVVLETIRDSEAQTITVTATKADGTTATIEHAPLTTTTPEQDITTKTTFNFARQPVVSDVIWLDISWPAGEQPRVQRAMVEYRIQPRQDPQ